MPGRSRQIFVVRHGLAEPAAAGGDAERPLSVEGKVRLRQIAQGLVALDVHFDLILCSPLKRTQQTAAILADAFEPRPRLVVSDALAPGGSMTVVAAEVDRYRRHLEIAIVGHEPGVGKLAAFLVGSKVPLPFKRGAVACVEVTGPATNQGGQLRWFATPKMLRSIGQ